MTSDKVTPSIELNPEFKNRLLDAIRRGGGPSKVSRTAGIPLSSLNDYLTGREPRFSRIVAIAAACGVSLDWLATGNGNSDDVERVDTDILDAALLDGRVDNRILLGVIHSACEYFEKNGAKPTLRELLRWIGSPYRVAVEIAEKAGDAA